MTPVARRRLLVVLALVVGVPATLFVAALSISNWDWLRGPLERQVEARTGRVLTIGGLGVRLGLPTTRIELTDLSFANPSWAREPRMLTARNIQFELAIAPLFRKAFVLDEVVVDRATIHLEKSADGRKNWLLDRDQRDRQARVDVLRLAVHDGVLTYHDPTAKTTLAARLQTRAGQRANKDLPLRFRVSGRYKGEPLEATGSGARLLSLRDNSRPYRMEVDGRVGPTTVRAQGHITNLLKLAVVDLNIRIRGGSLAQLYPVLHIVFPDTPPYRTQGRLRHADRWWRYEKFTGKVGESDIAGTLQVDRARARPLLTADLSSSHLDLADLGPVVGASPSASAPAPARPPGRVLPDAPFRSARWDRMDADVRLKARSIKRGKQMPISDLSTHLKMRNAVVTLDPLKFGVAGGTLAGKVTLDGNRRPIRAEANLNARKISLVRLFPGAKIDKTSFGELNGSVKLKGQGDTVAAMLGTAGGRVSLVLDGGQISRLMMETVSLHLLEMLQLKLTGDESIRVRCGIADFAVTQGQMKSEVLVLDTDIVRIDGAGTINLGDERLDLKVVPKTKKVSLLALRTPIHVRGTFSDPDVSLDKGRLALKGLGAAALAAINPALALLPLVDTGSGQDSDCRGLIEEARAARPR